jgi:hypothetical protein
MSSQNVRTGHFQHALETSAVEIASRRLHLNEQKQELTESVIVTAVLTVLNPLAQRRGLNAS